MSIKRQATTQLTHENWDQDDPSEHEEMGTFKTAAKDVLEKRVIRTAKRRSQVSGEETKKSVFSGFSGFNKTQPSSFDFLANLTNGNNKSGTPTKNDTSVTSSLFSSKPISSSSGGLFGTQSTSSPDKPSSGITTLQSPSGTNMTTSVFNTSKPDSTVSDSPFKIQPVSSSADTNTDSTKTVTSSTGATSVSSPIFGITTTANKSLFSNSNNTPFKIQSVSTTAVPVTNNTLSNVTANTSSNSNKIEETNTIRVTKNEKKLECFGKLKDLNEAVSDWIKTHVDKSPLCILSPIFKDYERYLKEIKEELDSLDDNDDTKDKDNNTGNSVDNTPKKTNATSSMFTSSSSTSSQSIFSGTSTAVNDDKSCNNLCGTCEQSFQPGIYKSFPIDSPHVNPTSLITQNSSLSGEKAKGGLFGNNLATSNLTSPTSSSGSFGVSNTANRTTINSTAQNNFTLSTTAKSSGFTFGIKTTAIATTSTNSTGFTFATKTTAIAATSTNPSGFSFATNTNTTTTSSMPFSFSTEKPFSFKSNITSPTTTSETKNEENEEDEPPKVEFTPLVEENSVFDKRCKIFVKRDGNFMDKGVGTLYIKKVNETGKHQLLVRANTTLGNILLNIILSSVPTERVGKNNVMLVCIPTPDEKPPPTPVLIRVKTSEEADELLEVLKKYKA